MNHRQPAEESSSNEGQTNDRVGREAYHPPRVELVLTSEALQREALYAGQNGISGLDR